MDTIVFFHQRACRIFTEDLFVSADNDVVGPEIDVELISQEVVESDVGASVPGPGRGRDVGRDLRHVTCHCTARDKVKVRGAAVFPSREKGLKAVGEINSVVAIAPNIDGAPEQDVQSHHVYLGVRDTAHLLGEPDQTQDGGNRSPLGDDVVGRSCRCSCLLVPLPLDGVVHAIESGAHWLVECEQLCLDLQRRHCRVDEGVYLATRWTDNIAPEVVAHQRHVHKLCRRPRYPI